MGFSAAAAAFVWTWDEKRKVYGLRSCNEAHRVDILIIVDLVTNLKTNKINKCM